MRDKLVMCVCFMVKIDMKASWALLVVDLCLHTLVYKWNPSNLGYIIHASHLVWLLYFELRKDRTEKKKHPIFFQKFQFGCDSDHLIYVTINSKENVSNFYSLNHNFELIRYFLCTVKSVNDCYEKLIP